jgi:hypothetical protein
MQMALARADSAGALFSGPVVVLAEEDKEWMDDTVSIVVVTHNSTCNSFPFAQLALAASPDTTQHAQRPSGHTQMLIQA